MSEFPHVRLRRLRRTSQLRSLFDSPLPGPEHFVWPVFVVPGKGICDAIDSMPGQFRYSPDTLLPAVEQLRKTGVNSVLLFGVAEGTQKDPRGSGASSPSGAVQQAIRLLRREIPELVIFTDVCLCAYTSHGHCGPLVNGTESSEGNVDNDAALKELAATALSHVEAGADAVAPSAMMDGQVSAIRQTLDSNGFSDRILMSYSTKFASSMYGPFRDAEKSAPGSGTREGYQASFKNKRLALRESVMDENEGADILMVKPSLFYLDILRDMREMTSLPLAAYNVSGEYSMIIAAAKEGWGDLKSMVQESIFAIHRAGADIIISYWANQYETLLRTYG